MLPDFTSKAQLPPTLGLYQINGPRAQVAAINENVRRMAEDIEAGKVDIPPLLVDGGGRLLVTLPGSSAVTLERITANLELWYALNLLAYSAAPVRYVRMSSEQIAANQAAIRALGPRRLDQLFAARLIPQEDVEEDDGWEAPEEEEPEP